MKPQVNAPCSMPAAMPRNRVGRCSSASGIPAAHSPPMPMPNNARNTNNMAYVVEKPLNTVKMENHRMDRIKGSLRPMRSAIVPAAAPPTRRNMSVTVPSAPASVLSMVKLRWMSTRTNVRMV